VRLAWREGWFVNHLLRAMLFALFTLLLARYARKRWLRPA
jgi:hypothetical protein